jgi:hypothetical protein
MSHLKVQHQRNTFDISAVLLMFRLDVSRVASKRIRFARSQPAAVSPESECRS